MTRSAALLADTAMQIVRASLIARPERRDGVRARRIVARIGAIQHGLRLIATRDEARGHLVDLGNERTLLGLRPEDAHAALFHVLDDKAVVALDPKVAPLGLVDNHVLGPANRDHRAHALGAHGSVLCLARGPLAPLAPFGAILAAEDHAVGRKSLGLIGNHTVGVPRHICSLCKLKSAGMASAREQQCALRCRANYAWAVARDSYPLSPPPTICMHTRASEYMQGQPQHAPTCDSLRT